MVVGFIPHNQVQLSKIFSIESCHDDLLKVILSAKCLYAPPFIVNKTLNDIRSKVHALMTVSKRWRRIMHELIVPLLNNKIIKWSNLPLVRNDKAFATPDNPIHKFLLQKEMASRLMRLDLRDIKDIHSDRLGEITALCINVHMLFLSDCYFDLTHLTKLSKLKVFWITESNLLNTSAMNHCLSLKNLRVERCRGLYWQCFNSELQKLYIQSKFFNQVEKLPPCLTSLTLSNVQLTEDNPLQSLTQLNHLSMDNQHYALDKLSSLESLEMTCDYLPEGCLEAVSHIKKLKISRSNNLPNFASFDNLTHLFLNSINFPEIGDLTKLTELAMGECLYGSETFARLTNLKKLTLKNYQWESQYSTLTFHDLPSIETLHISSHRLKNISIRALTSLRSLKINCKPLQELLLPIQTSGITDIEISKHAKRIYQKTEYKVMEF